MGVSRSRGPDLGLARNPGGERAPAGRVDSGWCVYKVLMDVKDSELSYTHQCRTIRSKPGHPASLPELPARERLGVRHVHFGRGRGQGVARESLTNTL